MHAGGKAGATLWQALHLSGKAKALQDLSPAHSSRVHQLQWDPQDSSCFLTLEDVALHSWQLREASAEVSSSGSAVKPTEVQSSGSAVIQPIA